MAGELTKKQAHELIHLLRTAIQEALEEIDEGGGSADTIDRIEEVLRPALAEEDRVTQGGELLFK